MSTRTEPDNGKHERLDTHITYTTPTHMREPTLTHTHTMSVSALNDKQQIAEKDQNTHTHTHTQTHTHRAVASLCCAVPYRIWGNNERCFGVLLPVVHSVTELITRHDKPVPVIGEIAERQKETLSKTPQEWITYHS